MASPRLARALAFAIGPALIRARIGAVLEERQELQFFRLGARIGALKRALVEVEADNPICARAKCHVGIIAGIAADVPQQLRLHMAAEFRNEAFLRLLFFGVIGRRLGIMLPDRCAGIP